MQLRQCHARRPSVQQPATTSMTPSGRSWKVVFDVDVVQHGGGGGASSAPSLWLGAIVAVVSLGLSLGLS